MPEAVSNILYDFTKQLKDMLQSNLSRVLVYGSYARGDYRENSDVDVMVLVKLPEDEIKGITSNVYDLSYDIELEKGIHISVVIKNEEQFDYWVDTLPFYRNVSKEGVEINAG